MRLAVFDEKIVAVIFHVKGAHMRPVLDALAEKYGRPYQANRYIENYTWNEGRKSLSIREDRLNRGYRVLLIDFDLFKEAQAANKNKAKSDL